MEIIHKITEPKLVWEIFTYVAEAPLTKERRKQIEEWRNDWSENGEYHSFTKFIKYSVTVKAVDLDDEIDNSPTFQERKPLSIILKLFENQECAKHSRDVGVKLCLDYKIIPPRFWCIAEAKYIKEYEYYGFI